MNCRLYECCNKGKKICCHECKIKNCEARCRNTPGEGLNECKQNYEKQTAFVSCSDGWLRLSKVVRDWLGECTHISAEELKDGIIICASDKGIPISSRRFGEMFFRAASLNNPYAFHEKERYAAEKTNDGIKIYVGRC